MYNNTIPLKKATLFKGIYFYVIYIVVKIFLKMCDKFEVECIYVVRGFFERGKDALDKQKIGSFSQEVINLLGLAIPAGTPIYIGYSNIEHIIKKHPYEYEKYFPYIMNIISSPNYVGINPSDDSISFVKLYQTNEEYVRVAVRITTKGNAFARSLHLLSTYNAERYIEKGTLKALTSNLAEV